MARLAAGERCAPGRRAPRPGEHGPTPARRAHRVAGTRGGSPVAAPRPCRLPVGPSAIPAQLRAASTPGPAGTSSWVRPCARLGRRLDTWASRQLAAPRLRPRCVLRLAQRALTKLTRVVYCMNNGGECAANCKLPPFTRATASPARLRSSASMIGRLPVQLDHARRQLTQARRLAALIAGSTAPRSTSGPLRSTACSTGR